MELADLKFYLVRNSEGKYFRAKGQGGYGQTWTELQKARVYTKLGSARSVVTFFANENLRYENKYPVPIIVEISVGKVQEINETERINKAVEKKEKKIAKMRLGYKQQQKERAEAILEKAKRDLEEAIRT